jgi:hypothetical protein
MQDLQTMIKSLEEKFEVQQQMVQYVQNKAESTDSKSSSYRLDVNILLKIITRLFAIMRESKVLPVPDKFLSLFNDITNRLD